MEYNNNEIFNINKNPYYLKNDQKRKYFDENLVLLTKHHYHNCKKYADILDKTGIKFENINSIENIPFLPARLFKYHELSSICLNDINRIVTSSGTSGQAKSKIILDRKTSFEQIRVLSSIIKSFIGKERLPLIILDTENINNDPSLYAVRGAGVSAFKSFSNKNFYVLDKNMDLKIDELLQFIELNRNKTFLFTGYTYIIWQYVINELGRKKIKINLDNGFLFHGGGWKKLHDQAIDNDAFSLSLKNIFGNISIHNYYGMAEQLGSIFVACEQGHLHCSIYSDILVRRAQDFSIADMGEKGLAQLFSILPKSYPGHSILTEDEAEILGEDDCPCGRMGKYFKVHGRVKNAEIRGCGDTYEKH